MRYFILSCLIFATIPLQSQHSYSYGLDFKTYEVKKDERTGLNLTPEKPFNFPDGFAMEFDVLLRKAHNNFGYIFRIMGNDDNHIDLVLHHTGNSAVLEPMFMLIYKSGQTLFNVTFKELSTNFGQWNTVRLLLNRKEEKLTFIVNGKEYSATDAYFGNFRQVDLVFGKNNSIAYQTSDIPSMSLRDVKIENLRGKLLYHWELSKHAHNGVYDEVERSFASVENPKWLLDDHVFWKKETSFTTGIYPQITFNGSNNEIAITDARLFYRLSLLGMTLKTDTFTGLPKGSDANQLLYNNLQKKYFTYNFIDKVTWYDSQTKEWDNTKYDSTEPFYWHHARYFSSRQNAFYTLGGYGFHTYKNDIMRYDFSSDTWQKLIPRGDAHFSPRYLSGLGVVDDDHLILFGGYGNEKGYQELSPRNYHDLYEFHISTGEIKKIWELNDATLNFVTANSMVVDTLNNCFYALCFSHQQFDTFLQLYRFSLLEPTYEILADSIPYQFNDTHSFADLYLDNSGKQLIALTSYTDIASNQATISIFKLAFPPLKSINLLQSKSRSYTMWLVFVLCLAFICVFFVWRKKISNKATKPVEPMQQLNITEESYDPIVGIKPINNDIRKRSILLFGGFQAIDKEGQKITGEFTPLLKQLFLLILLNTLKDGKGISSFKLKETLWFDKSEEKAKNNRGVSLSKLRLIFEKIGEISINAQDMYWIIQFGDDIYCDYYEALILMERLKKQPEKKDIKRLASIVAVGELLPNLQNEWVDPFKADFSNNLIDLLLNLISRASSLDIDSALQINIADAIFAHDSLNEDALKIKCRLLVETGKNGLAQKAYSSFIKEYQSLFGAEYKVSFEQLVG